MENFKYVEREKINSCVRLCAGTSFVRNNPCFSPKSNYLFVIADICVKVYSTNTGECLQVLANSDKPIVSIFLNPANNSQLITVSLEGVVTFWDYEDAVCIREISLKKSISCAFPGNSGKQLFIVCKKKGEAKLLSVSISTGNVRRSWYKYIMHPVPESDKMFAFNKKCSDLAVVNDYILLMKRLPDGAVRKHTIQRTMAFTCVTFHPTDDCIATGTNIGSIILWYNWADTMDNPTRMKLHWHSLPVADISFTAAGSYLYSGGSECVLVKWKPNADFKQFLPRLGMPICHVTCSPDNSFVATSHVDNSILLINPNNEVVQIIQGLTSSHHWEETSLDPVPCGLLHDPRSGSLVMNGRPGHLQFFSLTENKQLYNLDITQQNYISRERNRVVYCLEVTKAAFDPFGNWLATLEYRDDKETSPEIRLKFWQYKAEEQRFSLCTTIEMPHMAKVNVLVFRPFDFLSSGVEYLPLAVTTADDKRLKFWTQMEETSNPDHPKLWTSQGVGFYRDLPAGSVSFSGDGSVLAAAFGQVLTLWLPDGNVLRASLCHPRVQEPIRQVVFGQNGCSHLVACCTASTLTVWDTLTLSVCWCVQIHLSFLAGDPLSEAMAAFSETGDLYIFQPSNPDPILIHANAANGKVIASTFLPNQQHDDNITLPLFSKSQLYFMDQAEQNLYTVQKEDNSSAEEFVTKRAVLQKNLPQTPFSLLIAEKRLSGVEKIEHKLHEIKGSESQKIIEMICSTPCHVLPSPKDLCSSYLSSLMKPVKSRDSEHDISTSGELIEDSRNIEPKSDSDSDFGSDADIRVEAPNEEVSSKSTAPPIDEKLLKKIYNEDYSWLFESPLF